MEKTEEKAPIPQKETIKQKNPSDVVDIPKKVYNKREAVAFLMTQPNVFAGFQKLVNNNQLKNPEVVKRELKRLGHYVG